MEVQRVTRASDKKIERKEQVAQESVDFKQVMGNRRVEATMERLSQKMKEIEDQGKKLTDTQSVDNLRKYKRMIQDFLDDAVKNGLELKEQRGFNQRGSVKVYKLVKEVDKKLLDLTNAVLEKEDKGLGILGLVGEIQGLLINIYT